MCCSDLQHMFFLNIHLGGHNSFLSFKFDEWKISPRDGILLAAELVEIADFRPEKKYSNFKEKRCY